MVTLSAAWALPPSSTNAQTTMVMILLISKHVFLSAELKSRAPKGDGTFEPRDTEEEHRPRDRREQDLRPHDVEIEPRGLGRDAEPHPDDGRSEELRHDRTDERERRIELECVEDERE